MRILKFTAWVVATSTVVAVLTFGASPARADAGDASRLLTLTNQLRSSRGLGSLSVDASLSAVAQRWATNLAAQGTLSHNASLPSQVTGWKSLGENVGVGGTVDAIHAGFVASPTHQENLVDPAFTRVGFGIVRPDARIFVVEVFMKPAAAPAVAAPPTTTAAKNPVATPTTAAPSETPAAATTRPAPVATAAPSVAATTPAGEVVRPASNELLAWMLVTLERLRAQ